MTQFEEAQITRFFVQNGKKILPPAPHVDGIPDAGGGINKDYCESLSSVFDDYASPWFDRMGGYERHNEMLRQPMVLALSITDDVSPSELLTFPTQKTMTYADRSNHLALDQKS